MLIFSSGSAKANARAALELGTGAARTVGGLIALTVGDGTSGIGGLVEVLAGRSTVNTGGVVTVASGGTATSAAPSRFGLRLGDGGR